jgi:hypothetical protein
VPKFGIDSSVEVSTGLHSFVLGSIKKVSIFACLRSLQRFLGLKK